MEKLDQGITLLLNGLHSSFTDQMWLVFSDRKIWFPLYLLVAVALVWRLGWKKGLLMVLTTALAILCVDQFANLIKNWACRPRPCNSEYMVAMGHRLLERRSMSYSFFSAHAANAIAFAICSSAGFRMDKKKGRANYPAIYTGVIFFWAAMVGLSRIFVGKHYFGDVVVGFAAGALIACALVALFNACAAKATRTAA